MAKKKPNAGNLRQGQTVYISSIMWLENHQKYVTIISKAFITIKHLYLGPGSTIYVRLSRLKEFISFSGNKNVHTSRNKAQRRADILIHKAIREDF